VVERDPAAAYSGGDPGAPADFFCFLFGNDAVPHGRTSNDAWQLEGFREQGRTRVPTGRGSTLDLTRSPTPRGIDDLVCFVSDPALRFGFSAVSVPEQGRLSFQLKDPRVLAETLLCMANGGRHVPPWNGRVASVLGLEEITGFFAYGRSASLGQNLFRTRGYRSAVEPGPGGMACAACRRRGMRRRTAATSGGNRCRRKNGCSTV
jgi:hypothetical protein